MKIRLLSYNVHKGVGTDGKTDLARIADVIRHYDADVVALQEVMWYEPWRAKRSHYAELFDLVGLPYASIGLNCKRHFGIYGNVTLSRLPFLEHQNVDLTLPLRRPRGALHSRHATAPGLPELHVYNVHLGLARYERGVQTQRLVGHVNEAAPPDTPTVMLGDTNDWRDRLYPGVLESAGYRRHAPRARAGSHGTFPSWYPVADLDKVFVRGALRLVRVFASRLAVARVASDHLPLFAEIDLSADGVA